LEKNLILPTARIPQITAGIMPCLPPEQSQPIPDNPSAGCHCNGGRSAQPCNCYPTVLTCTMSYHIPRSKEQTASESHAHSTSDLQTVNKTTEGESSWKTRLLLHLDSSAWFSMEM